MTKAYLILAHKNEVQLIRLVDRLDDGCSCFFIHIDLSSSMSVESLNFDSSLSVILIKSVRTNWGSFGLVEATLKLMTLVKQSSVKFDRVILLSGQDYPIKTNEYINNFFNAAPRTTFVDHFSLPNYKKWVSGGGSYRVTKYFFGFSLPEKYAARTINFLSSNVKWLRRRLNKNMLHYYGSQWWSLDIYAMNYVLDFVHKNPEYSLFHQYTFAPDELFFQTILLNTRDTRVSGSIQNDNKMFMKWNTSSSAHPEILKQVDFDLIRNSTALFARKFDMQVDSEILEMIDTKCLN